MFRDLKIETNIRTIEDKSKYEIIKEFDRLQQEALDFENAHIDGEVLAIFVRWIGLDVSVTDLIEAGCNETPLGHSEIFSIGD